MAIPNREKLKKEVIALRIPLTVFSLAVLLWCFGVLPLEDRVSQVRVLVGAFTCSFLVWLLAADQRQRDDLPNGKPKGRSAPREKEEDPSDTSRKHNLHQDSFWGFMSVLLLERTSLLALFLVMLAGSVTGTYYIVRSMVSIEEIDTATIAISLPGHRIYHLPISPFGARIDNQETGWQDTQIQLKEGDRFKVSLTGYVSPGYLQGIPKLQEHLSSTMKWEDRHREFRQKRKEGVAKEILLFEDTDLVDANLLARSIAKPNEPIERGKSLPPDVTYARKLITDQTKKQNSIAPGGAAFNVPGSNASGAATVSDPVVGAVTDRKRILESLNAIVRGDLLLPHNHSILSPYIRDLVKQSDGDEFLSYRSNRLVCEIAYPPPLLKTGRPVLPLFPGWPFSGPKGYNADYYPEGRGDYRNDTGLTVQGIPHNHVLGVIIKEGLPRRADSSNGQPGYKRQGGQVYESPEQNPIAMIDFSEETGVVTAKTSGVLWVCINDADDYRWDNAGMFFMKLIVYGSHFRR